MADYFLVDLARGPEWNHSVPRRRQAGWDEHALFMDALADEGFVVLGGPVGDGDGEDVVLVVDAPSEATVRDRLADDPWATGMLTVERVKPWTVLLRGPEASLRADPM